MRCPYLSSASKKECVKMLAENMDADLSDFDLKHFCDGNPAYCYYFRLPMLQKAQLSKTEMPLEKLSREDLLPKPLVKGTSLEAEKQAWQK